MTATEQLARRITKFPEAGEMTDERIRKNVIKVMEIHAGVEAIRFAK